MVSNRNLLYVIWSLCIMMLALAGYIKINQINQTRSTVNRNVTSINTFSEIPNRDSSFFEDSSKSDVNKQVQTHVPKVVGVTGVTATSYIVGNTKTGKIYLELNSRAILPVASMSKLVTAFVATDELSSSTSIEITNSALLAPPDKSNLSLGEKFSLKEILYPLLLDSSNVAAEAISSSTKLQSDFLYLMKSYAWEIGMPNTFFADPSGVSPQNVASARDLFNLAKYLVNYRPDILLLTKVASTSVATTTDHGSHIFISTHPFIKDSRFIGGKTGRTPEARETMMTILKISDEPIAFIILGSQYGTREWDTRLLLDELLKKNIIL